MALTKDDINNALTQTSHKDDVKHSLSNYFEGLDEPVAVAIGINKTGAREGSAANVNEMVSLLRENGIDAVSFVDSDAAKPDKFVVNAQGVMFPFMNPQDSLQATVFVENLMLDNGFKLVGHANPQTEKAILYPAQKDIRGNEEKLIDLKVAHPNEEQFNEIEARNGGDYKKFIDEKVKFAYENSQVVDVIERSNENIAKGADSLFRGGTLGNNPYAVVSLFNSRKVAHSSPAMDICVGFSGKGNSNSTKGGAQYEQTADGLHYGFVYEFESMGDDQKYYQNVHLEQGYDPKSLQEGNKDWNPHDGDIYETPVLPHHNKLKAIYLHVDHSSYAQKGENADNVALHRFYPIPLDENGQIKDQEWRDFLSLHEPSDSAVVGYGAERQAAQKKEQNLDSNHSYKFERKELAAKNYEDISQMDANKFVGAFVHSGSLEQTPTGVVCQESLYLDGLGIKKLPDLSNITINRYFSANDIEEISATKLPKVNGTVWMPNATITDGDKISCDQFCKMLGYQNKPDGIYYSQHCTVKDIKGVPQGFSEITVDQIDFPITVNQIGELPKSKHGLGRARKINILDQSNIKSMGSDDFLRFTNGIDGLEFHKAMPFAPFGINLSKTNLATLPSSLRHKDNIESIILNSQVKFTSLDDFPITTNGAYNLNFDGDLKNETMESFLLKTKGKKWVSEYTEKAEDGHLIIKNNGNLYFKFSFNSEKYGAEDNPQMNIRSFPKDIGSVEFACSVDSSVLSDLDLYKQIEEQKNDEHISLEYINIDRSVDLTEYEGKGLSIKKVKCSDIKLPSMTDSVSLEDVELKKPINFDVKCQYLTLKNINFPEKSVVKFMAQNGEVNISNSSFPAGTTLDLSQAERVNLSNVDLSQVNVVMPKNAAVVCIDEGTKLPDGYELDLSGCERGSVSPDIKVDSLKLPKEQIIDTEKVILPSCVKEVPTSYIYSCHYGVEIPKDAKIVDDWRNQKGKPLDIKTLEKRGVSKEQIKALKKERSNAKWKGFLNGIKKLLPSSKEKNNTTSEFKHKVDDKETALYIKALREGNNPNNPAVKAPSKNRPKLDIKKLRDITQRSK